MIDSFTRSSVTGYSVQLSMLKFLIKTDQHFAENESRDDCHRCQNAIMNPRCRISRTTRLRVQVACID